MGVLKVEPFSTDPYTIQVHTADEWHGGYQLQPLPQYEITSEELAVERSEYTLTPKCYDCLDDMLLFCVFRDSTVLEDRGYQYGIGEHVEVKVKATIVSSSEVVEGDNLNIELEKKLSESYFVGEVCKAPEGSLIKKGAAVTSIRKCAVKSRLLNFPTESLVAIPEKLDAGEAVALVSTYLPAFGALHHGTQIRDNRFLLSSLRDKVMLVNGGTIEETDAVVKLALLGGASKIFLLQPQRATTAYHVGSHKVVMLGDDDPAEWRPRLPGGMDLIVDLSYPKHFDFIKTLIKADGRFVCRKPEAGLDSWNCGLEHFMSQAGMLLVPGATMYDFNIVCDAEYGEVIRDLKFLFRLLVQRKIRPLIDKYIKPADVSVIRESMRQNASAGAVVCENWGEVM